MLKTHSSIILFLFLSSLVFSQKQSNTSSEATQLTTEYQEEAVSPEPRFKFEQETIDYGKIEQNSNGLRSFKFENIGEKPLMIHRIETSCGCTVAKKPEGAVLLGQKDRIVVRYNTVRPGFFQKSLKIYYNHPTDSVKRVSIKGTVLKEPIVEEENPDLTEESKQVEEIK